MKGYFDDTSLLRAVVSHRLTGLSGPRALLVMAAHPVAFAGFFAHTGALDDPYARLRRTGLVLDSIAFRSRAQADRRRAPLGGVPRGARGRSVPAAAPACVPSLAACAAS